MYAWDLKGKNRSELGLTTVAGDRPAQPRGWFVLLETRAAPGGRPISHAGGRAGGGVWPTE